MTKIISLELNELNFEFIESYVGAGELPTFGRVLAEHGLIKTVSEPAYPYLEPWIQWPTVYTGKTYAEHKVFRLGDIVNHDHVQIWEYLEARGLTVGAVSPMNAANRCADPAFFLPDPWTVTPVTAEPGVERLYGLIKRLVNDNASDGRSLIGVAREVLPLGMRYVSLSSTGQYLRMLQHAKRHKWARAAVLDRLLADMFLSLWRKNQPDFSSLFLNAGAHIQHHHMYDAAVYDGDRSNPTWYSSAADGSIDPLLFIYRVYDAILADFLALKDTRVLISTGLSQFPNEREHYQYRLTSPEASLKQLGLDDFKVEPRMSRDFLLIFPSTEKALEAQAVLAESTCRGQAFISSDNRGETLFCQVHYHGVPEGLHEVTIRGVPTDLSDQLVLVSIENGLHKTTGYHVDTGMRAAEAKTLPDQPLKSLFDKLAEQALVGAGKSTRAALTA